MTCVSRWAYSLSLATTTHLCTDIRSDSQASAEVEGHIDPFLIISHWLVGYRVYHSWAQLLYLMVSVLPNQVSFQIVYTED